MSAIHCGLCISPFECHISHLLCRSSSPPSATTLPRAESTRCFHSPSHTVYDLSLLQTLVNTQIRTPLNTAAIGLEILEDEIESLTASGTPIPKRLLEIVSDVRDACGNALEVSPSPCNFRTVFWRNCESYFFFYESYSVQLYPSSFFWTTNRISFHFHPDC